MSKPTVYLSGFADEAVRNLEIADPEQQFMNFVALGMKYMTLRAVNFDGRPDEEGIKRNKNVIDLDDDSLKTLKAMGEEFGIGFSCLGTAIGKSSLMEDGADHADYKPREQVMADLDNAFDAGDILGSRLIRGFSFYPPKGADVSESYRESVVLLAEIAKECEDNGRIFGLEVEPNLVGRNAALVTQLVNDVASPNLVGIYDGANVHVQGNDGFAEYEAMRDVTGWFHIKDYERPCDQVSEVREDMLKYFCPVDVGLVGHERIFRDLVTEIEDSGDTPLSLMEARLQNARNVPAGTVPGVFLDLEPHVIGGGQFGGYSGPRGTMLALQALTGMLDKVGIGYDLVNYDQIRAQKQG